MVTMAHLGVTYDELIEDLERYGGMDGATARRRFPVLEPKLVLYAMRVADECPCCLTRFIAMGARHSSICPVRHLIARHRVGFMQCKDIPDRPILEFLAAMPRNEFGGRKWATFFNGPDGMPYDNSISKVMPPGTPFKLMRAKIAMLVRRGLVDACTCGCRGDIEITPKGLAHIGDTAPIASHPVLTNVFADVKGSFEEWAAKFAAAEFSARFHGSIGAVTIGGTFYRDRDRPLSPETVERANEGTKKVMMGFDPASPDRIGRGITKIIIADEVDLFGEFAEEATKRAKVIDDINRAIARERMAAYLLAFGWSPPLSSVYQPARQQGKTAATILDEEIDRIAQESRKTAARKAPPAYLAHDPSKNHRRRRKPRKGRRR